MNMKKRIVSAVMAALLCASMIGGTVFATFDGNLDAAGGSGTEITGDSGVESPVYKVVVPTSLVFAVDPFMQVATDSQISSSEFSIINKSNVAVKVQAAVKVTPKTGVTVKPTAAEVTETDNSKLVYIAAQVPKSVTETTDPESGTAAYPGTTGAPALKKRTSDTAVFASDVVLYEYESDGTTKIQEVDETWGATYDSQDGVTGVQAMPSGYEEHLYSEGENAEDKADDTYDGEAATADQKKYHYYLKAAKAENPSKATDKVSASTAVEDYVDTKTVKGDYTKSNATALSADAQNIVFALEKATYKEYYTSLANFKDEKKAKQYQKVAADTKGTATFRFTGTVNSTADWAASDLTASVKYTINGMTPTTYAAVEYAKTDDAGSTTAAHGLVLSSVDPSITNASFALIESGKTAVLNVDLGKGSKAATAVKAVKWSKDGADYLGNGWTWDSDAKTLTLATANTTYFASHISDCKYTIEFTGSDKTIEVTLTLKE